MLLQHTVTDSPPPSNRWMIFILHTDTYTDIYIYIYTCSYVYMFIYAHPLIAFAVALLHTISVRGSTQHRVPLLLGNPKPYITYITFLQVPRYPLIWGGWFVRAVLDKVLGMNPMQSIPDARATYYLQALDRRRGQLVSINIGLHRDNIVIMEKKMETTRVFRV